MPVHGYLTRLEPDNESLASMPGSPTPARHVLKAMAEMHQPLTEIPNPFV